MMTGSTTTTILLSRGSEDKYLLNDITRIFGDIGGSFKNICERYPQLMELQQRLRDEIDREEG